MSTPLPGPLMRMGSHAHHSLTSFTTSSTPTAGAHVETLVEEPFQPSVGLREVPVVLGA